MVQWQTNLANGRLVMPNADFPQEQLMVWLVNVGTADLLMHNACICGLGEMANFVRIFAQKVTVYLSPARCTGYALFCSYLGLSVFTLNQSDFDSQYIS
jgi:hypothetical protein